MYTVILIAFLWPYAQDMHFPNWFLEFFFHGEFNNASKIHHSSCLLSLFTSPVLYSNKKALKTITRKPLSLVFNSFFSFFFSFVSDSIEPDFFRKLKDKRPSAGSTAGQILPVISDKSSHVTQVQGSRQDQIGNLRIKQRCARTAGEKTPPLPASSDDICQFGVQHLLHSAVLKQFS